jgi:hypothetical protein
LALLVYCVAGALLVWLTHRFLVPLSRGAAAFLFFLPFLLVGPALVGNRVYAPIDKIYMDIPLSQVKAQYGIGEPHNPATADIFSQMIPWRHAVRESYARGEWPLWNPYILSGDILAAAAQPAPYSPFTLFALLLPAPLSFTFTAAITLLAAAAGAFAFARELGCREPAAAIAASGFALSSGIALYVLWPLGLSWALLPLVLLGTHRVAREASWSAWGLLTTSFVLLLLAGHPETALHVVVLALVYGVTLLPRGRAIGVALLAGAAALLLCAMFLLPYLEATPQTAEYAFRTTWKDRQWTKALPQVLVVLATDVFPSLHLRRWVQPNLGGLHGETAAVGSIVLALAAYGAWRVRSRASWFFAGMAVFCLLAHANFDPVAKALRALPLFDITLNDRLSFAAAFALVMLAALGAEALSRRGAAWTFAIVLGLLGAGTWWISRAFVIETGPREWGQYTAAAELAGLALALLALRTRFAVPAILVLLIAQRTVSEYGVHKSFPQRAAYPDMEIFAPLRNIDEPFRVAGTHWALMPATNTLYGLEDVRGYEAMTFHPYQKTWELWCVPQPVFFNRIEDLGRPLLSMMNVRFAFTHAANAVPAGWNVVARQGDAVLVENTRVLPRAFVPRLVTIGMQDEVAVDQMGAHHDFGEKAWITANVVPYERLNGPGRATIRRTPGGYTIDADMQGDGWIVVSNAAWKGWRAYVNGKRTEIQRANVAFQSVHVGAGRSEVRLVYRPQSFVVGRAVTLATLLVILAVAVLRRRRSSLLVPSPPAH